LRAKVKILELILNECQLFGIYMCDMPEYNYLATTVFAKRRSRAVRPLRGACAAASAGRGFRGGVCGARGAAISSEAKN
jgi:hypothetical protein